MAYRSRKTYRVEEFPTDPSAPGYDFLMVGYVRVIANDDNLTYAVLSWADFDLQYEAEEAIAETVQSGKAPKTATS